MPFDNAPERAPSEELSLYERLQILRELVPKSGNQESWRTCLWSVARRDKRLRAAGLAQYDVATGMGPRPASTISSAVIASGAPPARRRRRRRSTLPSRCSRWRADEYCKRRKGRWPSPAMGQAAAAERAAGARSHLRAKSREAYRRSRLAGGDPLR